jgi:hypothetical protein
LSAAELAIGHLALQSRNAGHAEAFDAQRRHRMEFSIEAWILPVQGNAVIDAKSPSAVPGDVEAA